MSSGFHLFGSAHLTILVAIPCAAAALAGLSHRKPGISRSIAGSLGLFLAINEIVWYTWRLHAEGFRFPEGLPLELCDLTLWMTVTTMLTLKPAVFEFAWLAGLSGSAMAVLTPDLWAAPLSYPTVYFFLEHGGVIASLLYLVWAQLLRPRRGCVWRTFGLLNAYAALIGVFNTVFQIRSRVNVLFETFVLDHIDARSSFALETTLRSAVTFEQAALARRAGFVVEMRYLCLPNFEMHLERVEMRADRGGHSALPLREGVTLA